MAKNGTGALYLADLGYPMLPQNATEQEKFDELQDYLFRLTEALRWTLSHLDETNFNNNFFLDFAVGERYEMLDIADFSVEVYRVGNYTVIAGVIGTLDGELSTTLYVIDWAHTIHPHYPDAVTMPGTDGDPDTTMDLTVTSITTQAHDGPL